MSDLKASLFASGDTQLFRRPFVAVVGTRRPSPTGLVCASEIAASIVRAGLVVASGLALGIDGAAHRGAMAAGGRTVALLGTPLDRVYPAAHRELQARIAREHLLLSPFAWGEPVTRGNFPRRDRVLAALSAAVVVIEAGEQSGTLHTVREAARLGRPILLAAPVIAAGCAWARHLLAARKARAVTLAEDWRLATKRIVVASNLALDL